MPQAKKAVLREQLIRRREALSLDYVEQANAEIARRLKQLEPYRQARIVHCYVSWRNEVDTRRLIADMLASGKRVVVPVVDLPRRRLRHSEITSLDDLEPGTFGILEPRPDRFRPVPPEELDLVLVPGVAFDRQGYRIGFGGGYYDDFLRHLSCPKIGLAYQFQLVDDLPRRPGDERVDVIITEEGLYYLE